MAASNLADLPAARRVLHRALLAALALLLALLGLAGVGPAHADEAAVPPPKRLKIGLVLAGGGAKGAAHVGVLKVLEAMHIPIDCIAGTSMGSIVGGLYAAGLSPEEIEREIRKIDWNDVFIDEPKREDRSFRRKSDDALYLFKAKPGFNDGKIELPLAYVHGQKFDLQLNRLTQRVAGVEDFDHLPIPFRAVAADLETGQEVVLKSGSLARALRASMAVPGAFDPVELDGRLLVDGGIANNIPVSVARAMGADVVIVSDLGSDLLTREQITSALDVAGQMVNFLFGLNSQKALQSLGPQDVHISVKLGDIGAASFDRVGEAIPLGEQAARQAAVSLSRYALGPEAYRRYAAARSAPATEAPRIDFVRIDNRSRIGDDVITSHISAKPGERLDVARLEHDIQQIYGLEIFESVRYELVDEDGKTGLVVHAREKPWGPGYLQTGLITSSNFEGDIAFRMGAAYTLTQINALNGEWRIGGQIGDEPGAFTEIFQPLDPRARYFVSGGLAYLTNNINTFDAAGNQTSQVRVHRYGMELGGGMQFGTWGQLRLGYLRQAGDAEVGIGTPAPGFDFDIGEAYVRLTDDKLDSLFFPTTGHFGRAEWRLSRKGLGADSDFDQVNLGYQQVFTWDRNTLIGGLKFSTTLDDNAPVQSLFRIGGFLNLSGFDQDRLSGQHAGLARVVYMRELLKSRFFKSYAGASLEAGNAWQDSGDIAFDNTIIGGSVFLGADTPVGPLYLAYGQNDSGDRSVYLFLGPLFSF